MGKRWYSLVAQQVCAERSKYYQTLFKSYAVTGKTVTKCGHHCCLPHVSTAPKYEQLNTFLSTARAYLGVTRLDEPGWTKDESQSDTGGSCVESQARKPSFFEGESTATGSKKTTAKDAPNSPDKE